MKKRGEILFQAEDRTKVRFMEHSYESNADAEPDID